MTIGEERSNPYESPPSPSTYSDGDSQRGHDVNFLLGPLGVVLLVISVSLLRLLLFGYIAETETEMVTWGSVIVLTAVGGTCFILLWRRRRAKFESQAAD